MFDFLKKKPPMYVEISAEAFDEVAEKLAARGVRLTSEIALDIAGVMLSRGPERKPDPLAAHRPLSPKKAKAKR